VVAHSLTTPEGYARRSRLVWAKNPSTQTWSYLWNGVLRSSDGLLCRRVKKMKSGRSEGGADFLARRDPIDGAEPGDKRMGPGREVEKRLGAERFNQFHHGVHSRIGGRADSTG